MNLDNELFIKKISLRKLTDLVGMSQDQTDC